MKRMFLFAAMACVALASCTKNEPVNVPQEDAITFAAPVVGLNTKAVEINGDYPTDYNFSVFAHYYTEDYTTFAAGKLYMDDVQTAYNSTLKAWNSTTNYYWPKQGTLTFAAYSPSTVAAQYGATGLKFDNFTVAAAAADQFDLLFSERSYNQTNGTMTDVEDPYKGVQLQFNHALASIVFNAKTDVDYSADNFEITLTKVEVRNVYSTADFDQNLTDGPAETTEVDEFGWTGHDLPVAYTAYAGEYALSASNALVPGITLGAVDAQNSHFILLPQPLTDAKLYVEYNIYNKNVDPVAVINQTAELSLATTSAPNWFRGNRYTYNLTIGLDKIYFDPVVTAWAPVEGGDFTVGNANQTL